MYRKITQTIVISMLTALILTIAAQAQIKDDIAPALVYDGVETSAGTLDEISGVRYGNTFVLRSTGEWDSRYLTVSINHRAVFRGIGVTGGVWSLTVFNENGYSGTIYGDVISGDIRDLTDDKGKIIGKQTQIKLIAIGGTGNFANEKFEQIGRNLEMLTALATLEIKGLMQLNF